MDEGDYSGWPRATSSSGPQAGTNNDAGGNTVLWRAFDQYRDAGMLTVRLGFGFGFTWFHGLPKLTAGPDGWTRTGDAVEKLRDHIRLPMVGTRGSADRVAGRATSRLGPLLPAGLFCDHDSDDRGDDRPLRERAGDTGPRVQERVAVCRSNSSRAGPVQSGSRDCRTDAPPDATARTC